MPTNNAYMRIDGVNDHNNRFFDDWIKVLGVVPCPCATLIIFLFILGFCILLVVAILIDGIGGGIIVAIGAETGSKILCWRMGVNSSLCFQ